MKPHHTIGNLHFRGECMVLTIDGEERTFSVREVSPALTRASEAERNAFEISPSGYGIHWPMIDEDISVDGLLGIVHTREQKRKSA